MNEHNLSTSDVDAEASKQHVWRAPASIVSSHVGKYSSIAAAAASRSQWRSQKAYL